jgi:hypothetical protein
MIDWISVNDRLPEENQRVLMFDYRGRIADYRFTNDWWLQKELTHWAEINLPESEGE